MKTVLETKNIIKVYETGGNALEALKGINLQVKEGEFVGIMGPSGSGKTTLLNVLSTIDNVTSGEILIDGKDIVKMNDDTLALFRRNHLGFIFQDYNLLDTLIVKENIALPLALSKVEASEIDRRVLEIAKKFEIEHILNQFPYQVSGGQKQRCAASRAIITNPSMVFGDEPTGALDSKSATDLLESMKSLNEQDNSTILMVTHDAFAASYCKRVIFIKDGELCKELHRRKLTRKQFFQQVVDVMSSISGGVMDDVI
ncbi:ABC transporter ATP-binding protein [Bacillus thuringiensis]|uniref:ABC transporter ATP-binding protein n=1 Tax=Bacillus thuringiensis TaxID=1428 RepID=A0A9X6V4T5_BACTU|nr:MULTISPECIES: ABC transporter ATP-binding protein [Bacillus]AJQ57584.1 bacitracin ABC transporter ATP-binding protein [Bacillus thuringiensis serovar morrisoni]AMR83295.1 bacitracin ABC transporter ATP-binding protein [Bacillus thuringiensis]EOO06550.1 ABC transporter ATP-binding protein [Bacillus cereus str. Schrouff]EOO83124.1 ABC transporter ATP-binding protein [Bacillus cereus K-5975c]KIP22979.1 ABC transporter family protein [Bacillus thuringiensis serovar morrisoni]